LTQDANADSIARVMHMKHRDLEGTGVFPKL
jgi:hypothetical protein